MNDFVWGTDPSHLYALYLPTRDRFIVVYHDQDVLSDLQNLLSSKCSAVRIDVSIAPEYHPTIIDNSICENWTIRNRDQFEFSYAVWCQYYSLDGGILGLKEQSVPADVPTMDLKNFCQTALQILLVLKHLEKDSTKISDKSLVLLPLFFSSQKILPYHSDTLSKRMEASIESRYQEEQTLRQNIVERYKRRIYWAQDQKELEELRNEISNLFNDLTK